MNSSLVFVAGFWSRFLVVIAPELVSLWLTLTLQLGEHFMMGSRIKQKSVAKIIVQVTHFWTISTLQKY